MYPTFLYRGDQVLLIIYYMNLMASQTACGLHNYSIILLCLFYYNVDLLVFNTSRSTVMPVTFRNL